MRYYQPANNAPDKPGAGMFADSASVCSNNAMNGACCWGFFYADLEVHCMMCLPCVHNTWLRASTCTQAV